MLLGGFCSDTAKIWYLLGNVVTIIKIVIPLILIILGMVDLGKAVVSSDDKAINKSVTALIKRFVAAVVMFFIPTIVSAIFNVISNIDLNASGSDAQICVQCLTNNSDSNTFGPDNKNCKLYAKDSLGV